MPVDKTTSMANKVETRQAIQTGEDEYPAGVRETSVDSLLLVATQPKALDRLPLIRATLGSRAGGRDPTTEGLTLCYVSRSIADRSSPAAGASCDTVSV
jgi:hypothetical protein